MNAFVLGLRRGWNTREVGATSHRGSGRREGVVATVAGGAGVVMTTMARSDHARASARSLLVSLMPLTHSDSPAVKSTY